MLQPSNSAFFSLFRRGLFLHHANVKFKLKKQKQFMVMLLKFTAFVFKLHFIHCSTYKWHKRNDRERKRNEIEGKITIMRYWNCMSMCGVWRLRFCWLERKHSNKHETIVSNFRTAYFIYCVQCLCDQLCQVESTLEFLYSDFCRACFATEHENERGRGKK